MLYFFKSPKIIPNVLVLSKIDCHLCDEAIDTILKVKSKHKFNLEIIKINIGDNWYESYWDKIPVIFIHKRLAFKYRLTENEFIKKLNAKY